MAVLEPAIHAHRTTSERATRRQIIKRSQYALRPLFLRLHQTKTAPTRFGRGCCDKLLITLATLEHELEARVHAVDEDLLLAGLIIPETHARQFVSHLVGRAADVLYKNRRVTQLER